MEADEEIAKLIIKELQRQRETLDLIPSENFAPLPVLSALGSVLTNKYSEGYPGRRYYGGNEVIDEIEKLAIERAKKVFGVPYVNVQPYSGTPANLAVYVSTCKVGDTIMGLDLREGGHLSHGWEVSLSGILYKSVPYHLDKDGFIDIEGTKKLAREHKPKLIWCGYSAYVRTFPFKEFGEIADEVGAYMVADIAHIAGLVAAGVHPNPSPYAHIVTTTTHKTLRGPRAAMIMVTDKGLQKDEDLPEKIDKAVFPGLQGGPHENNIAAIAVALKLVQEPAFREYAEQVVKNARALAKTLVEEGFKLVTGGTDTHMVLIDLSDHGVGKGILAQEALELCGVIVNKNTVPGERSSPFYPSGIRAGTPAVTSRGMKEKEMEEIGEIIVEVSREALKFELPSKNRQEYIREFKSKIRENNIIVEYRRKVKDLCEKFPLYEELGS
ncbi:MAG: serine hydroxymethyltransferase [Candidatus Brockarchaeota archaeon]|nr:serine hydroxymethyltransferase [Candidatus Brockarchaeota archaeon]